MRRWISQLLESVKVPKYLSEASKTSSLSRKILKFSPASISLIDLTYGHRVLFGVTIAFDEAFAVAIDR